MQRLENTETNRFSEFTTSAIITSNSKQIQYHENDKYHELG